MGFYLFLISNMGFFLLRHLNMQYLPVVGLAERSLDFLQKIVLIFCIVL
jgi:hypothetical protein